MKITVNEEKKESEIKYPCLMKNSNTDSIALFSAPKTGILIKLGARYTSSYIGEYSSEWSSYFKPFNGSITLEND